MSIEWRERPIPLRPNAPTALAYSQVPVDLSHPMSGEALVDIADYGVSGVGYYARTDGYNAPYYRAFDTAYGQIWSRRSVAERLRAVNRSLERHGVELFAFNGFRSVPLQQELWDFFLAQADIVLDAPTEDQRVAFAATYCSDPRRFDIDDSRTWPTHSTGGAIDITLRIIETKEPLFMGGVFDDPCPTSHTAYLEGELARLDGREDRLTVSQREALRNRRLLYWSMADQGFAGYAYEWWHFDWGTQMWVVDSGADSDGHSQEAWYGPAEPPI